MRTTRWITRLGRAACVGATSALMLLAAACADRPIERSSDDAAVSGETPGPRPDIYLITIDTLRSDHTSLHGYHKPTTPFLASIKRDSVRFDRAYSTSSWTLPAVVSLLSGLEPTAHGVRRGFVDDAGKVAYQDIVSPELPLLPEMLQAAGYFTVGITANAHLDGPFGFARGFDDYRNLGFAEAEDLHAEIRRVVDSAPPSDGPRFVWVHYLDPHWPYRDHDDSPAAIRVDIPRLQPYLFPLLERFSSAEEFHEAGIKGNEHVLRHAVALYDGEVRHVDRHVEQLFDTLHISRHDLVIVTADHGEEFLDHGEVGHAGTLFEETIRVPLLTRFPRGRFAGMTIQTPVSLVDVTPTVLDYLGLEPPPFCSGRSILPLLRGEPFPTRSVRASLSIYSELESVTFGDWKYIHDLNDPGGGWLFDLATDRGERRNLVRSDPRNADRMRRLLTETIELATRERLETVTIELNAERADQLRSLGYLR